MKQFGKQLLAGLVGIVVVSTAGFAMYWIARFVVWVCSFIKFGDIWAHMPWILLGMLFLALIELFGVLILWIFGRMKGKKGKRKTREYYEEEEEE